MEKDNEIREEEMPKAEDVTIEEKPVVPETVETVETVETEEKVEKEETEEKVEIEEVIESEEPVELKEAIEPEEAIEPIKVIEPEEPIEINEVIEPEEPVELKEVIESEELIEPLTEKAVQALEDEVIDTETKKEEDDYDELLEKSLAGITDHQIGDKVTGEIINITDSYIFVTLGGKRDAYADKSEFTDKKGELKYKVGDNLTGYISKYSDTETCVSRSLIGVNLHILREAYEQKIPVAGKVISMIKGGLLVDVSGIRAFCPLSQISNKMVPDYKVYLSNDYDFRVIDFTENGKNIVLSRRAILEESEKQQKEMTLSKIQIGDIIKGKVVRLTNFGAFIDIGGLEGLLHISEFAHRRVESPSDMVTIGEEVEAKIIRLKGDKVSLSFKAMTPDPTDLVLAELEEGSVIKCRVLRNLPFGSFVEIQPGVEGLVPISEMDRNRRVVNANDILTPGDIVEVQVLKVRAAERKVSLSLKALQPDPWETIDDVIRVNDVIEGVIENVANFGTFIKISDGVTGLLPNSKMKIANLNYTKENIGETVKIRVSRVDIESKRISLEPTDMPETERKDSRDGGGGGDWRSYKQDKKDEVDEDNPFNIL
ncbi:MAG: S1 RNA-binding domain-containing protein [Candidatus Stygibacter australis]|nr:S1 RNA-binding domain-containing protein [Candidatus Stygibacter australis]